LIVVLKKYEKERLRKKLICSFPKSLRSYQLNKFFTCDR
jgi:hypothetical protein